MFLMHLSLRMPHQITNVILLYSPTTQQCKQQVFDHDMMSKDDLMGEAEIDLQTMINAAAAFGNPELLGDMQIGRWLKSEDNALVRDSAVVVAGGKVKQGVSLKLQHTESGELELEMEWMPLNM